MNEKPDRDSAMSDDNNSSFITHHSPLIPRLRFPEFREAGEWEAKKLGDKNVSAFVKERVALEELEIDTFVSTENIMPDFAGIKTASKLPSSGSFIAYMKDDILIANIRPYLKKVWMANRSGSASNDVVVVRPSTKNDKSFLSFLLKNEVFITYVMKGAKGVKMPRGDISLMKEYPIALPDFKEQQKIADCLSSIDVLITAHSQKLDALKAHKKGLMQQLFPREGETVPRLRFPEFRDAGEWEEKMLADFFSNIRNGFVGTASPYYEKAGVPYLQGKNIKSGDIDKTGLIRVSNNFHKKQKKSQLNENDILMVQSGHVGECAVVGKEFSGANCHALIVLSPNGNVCSSFFKYLFYAPPGVALISKVKTGNTIAHILATDLRAMLVRVPGEKEQQKIADCLASIDALITAQGNKIDALKAHKKGLMQQLFPIMEDEA